MKVLLKKNGAGFNQMPLVSVKELSVGDAIPAGAVVADDAAPAFDWKPASEYVAYTPPAAPASAPAAPAASVPPAQTGGAA